MVHTDDSVLRHSTYYLDVVKPNDKLAVSWCLRSDGIRPRGDEDRTGTAFGEVIDAAVAQTPMKA